MGYFAPVGLLLVVEFLELTFPQMLGRLGQEEFLCESYIL